MLVCVTVTQFPSPSSVVDYSARRIAETCRAHEYHPSLRYASVYINAHHQIIHAMYISRSENKNSYNKCTERMSVCVIFAAVRKVKHLCRRILLNRLPATENARATTEMSLSTRSSNMRTLFSCEIVGLS